MNTPPQIAIAILNYNGLDLLKQFLPQVISNSSEGNIYIIDNGSDDDSIYWIKTNYPSVKIIPLGNNFGYARGYNQGVQQIKEPLICFLNNDVQVPKNWLEPILMEFDSKPQISIAQPLILNYKQPKYFEYAGAGGGYLDFFGFPYCRGRIFNRLKKVTSIDKTTRSIFWASGACFLVKKEVFMIVGGFDEDFFCYHEEIDFCWRAKRYGYSIAAIGQSQVYHLGSGSNIGWPSKVFYNHRNSLMMLVKNLPLTYLIIILPCRLLMDFFIGLVYLFRFRWASLKALVFSHWSFFRTFPRLIQKRKSLKKYPFIKHFKQFSILSLYSKEKTKKHFNI
ncbi:MAG: glycosyltransferase family 2 protein [Flavobacteriaceae bacterium]|nr:glycosyltransferase family 2 protein [Flavobacteriaceae bacterium]MCY4266392.1 glycosyltransferase family 2 protein [Flavobacteriaceae bacterium]